MTNPVSSSFWAATLPEDTAEREEVLAGHARSCQACQKALAAVVLRTHAQRAVAVARRIPFYQRRPVQRVLFPLAPVAQRVLFP